LPRIQLLAVLLILGMSIGCKAQTSASPLTSMALNRHIEVMVRSQFNVPQDYMVTVGARTASQVPGFQTLPITLSRGEHKTEVEFLISDDSKTLARLEKFDLLADPAFSIDVQGRPVRGNPAAQVTVVNFDDFECPYCARMHQTLFPQTIDRYKGLVRFIYKDNPLTEIHPWALHAAVDANCLAAQSGEVFWNYVDYLHSHGQEVNGEDQNLAKSFDALNRIARQQGMLGHLDSAKLDHCIAAQDESQVHASMKEAEALRIDGAPALFVDGERISGALPGELLWQVIDRALRAHGVEPPALTPQPAATAKSE
jgi:protein-disulfide isomerase